jgi:peptide/nickel transport system permease protein
MRVVVQRLGQMFLVVIAVTFLAFAAMNLLGDPLFNILGPASAAEEGDPNYSQVVEARETYHLDDPFVVRYGRWFGDVATGDFGRSFKNQENVRTILADKLPVTVLLMVYAQFIAIVVSVPWALWTASRAYRLGDKVSTVVSFGLLGIPVFALVVILFWLFAVKWEIFPTRFDDSTLQDRLWSLFLPAVALATPLIATYQRLLRTDLISTLQEDFIAVARAKGMSSRHVLFRHALRPSLFSMLTVFGIQTGALIGGSIVVEQYFGIPGIGRAVIEAIIRDDFPLVLAVVVVVSVIFVVVNFLVDLLYSYLDPRVSFDG